jgi:hypothetical protein
MPDLEIHPAMKSNVAACAAVAVALFVLFRGRDIADTGFRLYSQFRPWGFAVTYYRGAELSGKPLRRRTEPRSVRDYGRGRAFAFGPRDNWSARWLAVLKAPATGDYDFYLESDDGSRLFIDEALVMDAWSDHGFVPGRGGRVHLREGDHSVRIEHYDRIGPAAVRLKWAGGPIPPNTILEAPYVRKPAKE